MSTCEHIHALMLTCVCLHMQEGLKKLAHSSRQAQMCLHVLCRSIHTCVHVNIDLSAF